MTIDTMGSWNIRLESSRKRHLGDFGCFYYANLTGQFLSTAIIVFNIELSVKRFTVITLV
jgi:hypothetical protein